ncbi:MAG: TonB family protein [Halothiobacillaceae bacterium]
MSITPAWSPPPSRRLSLGLAMAVAALLHLLLLALFLHTHAPRPRPLPAPLPILQIELAPHPTEPPPERPDRVAEANQRAEETRAPKAEHLAASSPTPSTHASAQASSTLPSAPKVMPIPPSPPQNKNKAKDVTPEPVPSPPSEPQPDAVQTLAERSLQMSRLHHEILEQKLRNDAAARSAVLTANTTYGPEAAYLRAWVEKVERIGNLNFPDEARRKKLSGWLILEVVLDDQGRVRTMRVRQSSGEPVLDQAAQDIVRLASPFAPFPPELRMKYDQLTIIRTWGFDAGGQLDAR